MARDRASRPEARPLRLFVAVDVPDAVKEGLAASVAPFRDRIPGARWTGFNGWHVTVKFLGSTWPFPLWPLSWLSLSGLLGCCWPVLRPLPPLGQLPALAWLLPLASFSICLSAPVVTKMKPPGAANALMSLELTMPKW